MTPLYGLNDMIMPTLGFSSASGKLCVSVAVSSAVNETSQLEFKDKLKSNLCKLALVEDDEKKLSV
eukprot:CAMPEP_0204857214 /NCGR_PEP_ID=MMETSP1347-20130617/20349_1 /ASSEMBLY_ACC=CAM_ASM_000690 /TAXON_ID=215587 /ORGANISM="Aplanochytrium stocchinoi, Strain GSBS06" /LENGTH=65 /DNA_ID=CAMNT_0052004499 /DNA_START=543 /DNA_END=740 /DNA_ORIENTATION=-